MFDTIAMEFKKLKRNTTIRLAFLGNLVPPLLNFLIYINRKINNTGVATLEDMLSQTITFYIIFFGILIYGLVSSYVFSREYEEDTFKALLTIPVSRNMVIVSKLIVISVIIFLMVAASFAFSVIFSVIGGFSGINMDIILRYIPCYLMTYLLNMMLMPFMIFITFLFKKYIPTMIFAIVASTVNIVIINSKYAQLFPFSIPFVLTNSNEYSYYPLSVSIAIIVSLFLVSLILCFVFFRKEDL